VTAGVKAEMARLQLEQEDAMAAALACGENGGPTVKVPNAHGVQIMKVKVMAAITIMITNIDKQIAEVAADEDKLTTELLALEGDESVKNMVNRLCQTNTELSTNAAGYLKQLKNDVLELKRGLHEQEDYKAVEETKKSLSAIGKKLTKEAVKSWRAAVRTTTTSIESHKRGTALSRTEAVAPGDAPVRYRALLAVTGSLPITSAGFEAKAGIKACLVPPKAHADVVEILGKVPFIKQASKRLTDFLKKEALCVINVESDAKGKKLLKTLKTHFDSIFFTALMTPNEAWAEHIYSVQVYGSRKHSITTGPAAFCCTECRLVLTGSETVIGLPDGDVPGSDFLSKRNWLDAAGTEDLILALSQSQNSFCTSHNGSSMLVIPSGFLLVYVSTGTEGTTGLRWSVSGCTNDSNRVCRTLKASVEAFKELADPKSGYPAFLRYLDSEE